MANAVIGHVSFSCLAPYSICKTKIRVTHHTKDACDAPIDHCFGHHIRNGPLMLWLSLKPDINAVITDFDSIGFLARIFMPSRRLSR